MSTLTTPETAVIVRNGYTDPEPAPTRPEGPYRFEMVFDDGKYRAYADTADALLAALIPGYATQTGPARLASRLHLAVRTQTTMQAVINTYFGLDEVTPEEYAVLVASRATPPLVDRWDCAVPLVLVDAFYAPHGTLTPPQTPQDVTEPDNLIWLRPNDPAEFLVSLRRVGLIGLAEHSDFTV